MEPCRGIFFKRKAKEADRCLGDQQSRDNSDTSEPKKNTRELTFCNIAIREYEVVPGCNPSITDGPPVELGWRFLPSVVYSLDQYERSRCRRCCNIDLLKMPACVRENLLRVHGNDEDSIWKATEEAYMIKAQRESTASDEILKSKEDHRSKYFGRIISSSIVGRTT